MSIKDNLQKVLDDIERIKKENNITRDIKLVAVSKTYPAEAVNQAIEAGHFDFGENRVQEGIEKIGKVNDSRVNWHLVGHLQSNKAKLAVSGFDIFHSIGRTKIAKYINKYAGEFNKKVSAFIQVNTSGEDSKYGCEPEDTHEIASYIINECPNIILTGLMTIGPLYGGDEETKKCFKKLSELKSQLSAELGSEYFNCLSMGMSADYEIAIKQGATHLRIGSAIFGVRK
jgi:hypothetical protein